jgi:biotin synthase
MNSMNYDGMADEVISGSALSREQAMDLASSPDVEILTLLSAAFKIRRRFHGRTVNLHILQNAKSGLCPEDCKFCSQSTRYGGDAERYPIKTVEDLLAGARTALASGAVTYCMVTSTRGPSARELQTVCEASRQIKGEMPGLRLCASLGLLADGQAGELKRAGVDRYNHNLETSPRHFPEIVTTHSIQDRVSTVKLSRAAGLEACCGGILGMGEDVEDWVDLALLLRELEVESVPVNFLDPRPGTPLGAQPRMSPVACLRALSMFRFVLPKVDLRIAGGREATLRSMQPLALFAANSMFTEGYLTTPGAKSSVDLRMIAEAGFEPAVAPQTPTSLRNDGASRQGHADRVG